LREVKKRIGYGIILNTSLNMSNKPIVNTPSEAIELIRNTDLDIMILENYIIRKEDIVNSS
jgi:carbamoyltransferase